MKSCINHKSQLFCLFNKIVFYSSLASIDKPIVNLIYIYVALFCHFYLLLSRRVRIFKIFQEPFDHIHWFLNANFRVFAFLYNWFCLWIFNLRFIPKLLLLGWSYLDIKLLFKPSLNCKFPFYKLTVIFWIDETIFCLNLSIF